MSFSYDRHCENNKWHGTSYLSGHIARHKVKSTIFSKRDKIRQDRTYKTEKSTQKVKDIQK